MPRILTTVLILLTAIPSLASDWPYSDEHRSRLAFVHPLVNYSIHPGWQRTWERNLQSANGVQVTSGSVSTDDLYTDFTINVSEPLNAKFRFLYRGVWRDGLHWDRDWSEHWLGFEMGLGDLVSAHLQVHPAPDKEELGLLAGFMVHDAEREKYLRLSVRWDDFLYEEKNDEGGTSKSEPISLQWEARGVTGPWEAFTAGRYGSGSERQFPDTDPELQTYQRDGGSTLRLRHVWSDETFAGLETTHYVFEEQRHEGEADTYDNEWIHLRGLGVLGIGGPWGLRPEIHWLRQWSQSTGQRTFDHEREDFFPALFVELHAPGRSTWELGYLATHHSWVYAVGDWEDDTSAYTDKLKLGWTYAFTPLARVQFSISHELDLDRFGGGNVMFQINF
jgi:hypothetical protein